MAGALMAPLGCGSQPTAPTPDVRGTLGTWSLGYYAQSAALCPRAPAGFVQSCGGAARVTIDARRAGLHAVSTGRGGCQSCSNAVDFLLTEIEVEATGTLLTMRVPSQCRLVAALPAVTDTTVEGEVVCGAAGTEADMRGTWSMTRVP